MSEFELNVLLCKVCATLNVSIEDIKSKSRSVPLVDVRLIFVARASVGVPKPDARKIMQVINRDRTLFYTCITRYLEYLQYNPPFLEKVKKVESALREVKQQAA